MPNVEFEQKHPMSTFRKLAIGTWQTVGDPSVYGMIKLPADKVVTYLEAYRARSGRRVTITHLMAKAIALVLAEMPEANAVLRFNRVYLRKKIGIFFQVSIEDSATGKLDLSGATIFDAHQKSLAELVDEFEERVNKVRKREDKELEGSRNILATIPGFLRRWVINTVSFLSYTLNLDLRWAGVPKDPFGSAMITNIGSLGLEEAYAPLVPYSRVPLLVAVAAIKQEATVVENAIVPTRVLKLCATFDHRIIDGAHAAKMCKTLRRIFDNPEIELGPLPAANNS